MELGNPLFSEKSKLMFLLYCDKIPIDTPRKRDTELVGQKDKRRGTWKGISIIIFDDLGCLGGSVYVYLD